MKPIKMGLPQKLVDLKNKEKLASRLFLNPYQN